MVQRELFIGSLSGQRLLSMGSITSYFENLQISDLRIDGFHVFFLVFLRILAAVF